MRKIKLLVLVSVLIVSAALFSGCANKILYGTWQMTETIDAETGESEEPMFMNMMVFTVNRDGTVMLMDSLFGTFEKDGNEYEFTYDLDDDEDPKYESGAWELIGTDLYLYDENKPLIYHFVAVTRETDDEQE